MAKSTTTRITKSQLVKLIESAVKAKLAADKAKKLQEQRHGSSSVVDEVLSSFLEAATWSTSDQGDENGEGGYDDLQEFSYSNEALQQAEQDVAGFIAFCERELGRSLEQICADNNQTPDMFGHDLWLTAAGHGAGFWDGDWEPDGDTITDLVKRSEMSKYEFSEPYPGDDGLIYFG